jgi:hypothetical protein
MVEFLDDEQEPERGLRWKTTLVTPMIRRAPVRLAQSPPCREGFAAAHRPAHRCTNADFALIRQ